jgi:GAF domain-containing protein
MSDLIGHATVGADLESQAGYAIHQYLRAKQSGSELFAPVIVADVSSERRFRVPAVIREHGVVSGMSVVIPGAERPWGVLGVHSRTPRRFEPREAEFLQAAANVLSAALARCVAHAASQESERRYRILFEASPEPMFVFDRESLAIVAANRRMVEHYGWWREELLG